MTDMSSVMQWKGRLGVPYQGSKNAIAKEIIGILPRGKRFVDLFAGGCAMTHAAMISGKYDKFLANDLHGFGLRLFRDAIAGKCNGRWREWVTREDFHARKESDPLVAICWSFGNGMTQYIYGKDKEELKRAAHLGKVDGVKSQAKTQTEALERLQALERLHALERLQALERLHSDFGKYTDFKYEDGDVVYCDPPYQSATEEYRFMKKRGMKFDHSAFWDCVRSKPFPIFVSEYHAPSDFTPIWSKGKSVLMSQHGSDGKVREFVFVHERFADRYQTDLFGNI